jgi:pyrimidine operon attenuation protein/uracil phosphoribosyltransferase
MSAGGAKIDLDAEAIFRTFVQRVREHIAEGGSYPAGASMSSPAALRLIGIHTGGVWLAERLRTELGLAEPVGVLDISFYRDDFSRNGLNPSVRPSQIPFDVTDHRLLLVDDVLYTGRTVRAAMNELFDYGRPSRIDLAVLIDRGGRELPIAPDVAGRTIELPADVHVVLSRDPQSRLQLRLEQRDAG